jgi:CRP-like cAMP-binding protein
MPTTEKKPTPVSFVSPKHNHILEALPAQDYARLLPDLQPVSMPLGLVLCESGAHMHYIYFPTTSIVSLTYVMKNGATGEIAVTGNEGLVGISLFMGDDRSPNQAVVQSAGEGYRLHASIVKQEFTLGGKLHYLALLFTQSLIAQMSQTAVCNRHHTVDQQLCRLLLLSLDRLSTNELVMTQELIANMLGVRREGVTEAASKLQQDGMITYKRGHIAVVDRPKLEKRVCECYAVVKNEYDRLLSCHPL